MKKYTLLLFCLGMLLSCNQPASHKPIEKELPKKKITTEEAIKLAEKQFEKYLPKLLKSHEAVIDVTESTAGDFTGDGIPDVAIYFSLAPREGGNAIVDQGLSLYKNTGYEVKVLAGYDPETLFVLDTIRNGTIYIEKLEYAPEDGRCCPSIKTKQALTITGNVAR